MECPRLIHVISGQLSESQSSKILNEGSNFLQPYATAVSLQANLSTTLLITDQF